MPTTYKQIWSSSDGTSATRVVFVVSDTFAELFNYNSANAVDVFEVDKVKRDQDTEPGKFAIDELSFDMLEKQAVAQADIDAITFVLGSAENRRYCALFVNPNDLSPDIDDADFIGLVNSDISSKVVRKSYGDYNDDWLPVYDHKLKATSFDAAVLNEVTMQEVQDAILADSAWLAANVSEALQYNDGTKQQYVKSIFNLSSFLNKLAEISRDKIRAIVSDNLFTFNLLDSSAGYSTLPMRPVDWNEYVNSYVGGYELADAADTRALVFGGANSAALNQPYFHESMFNLSEGVEAEEYDAMTDEEKNVHDLGKQGRGNSFMQYEKVTQFLFGLSYPLLSYLVFEMPDPQTLNFYYSKRGSSDGPVVYVKGVSTADFQTGPGSLSRDSQSFYGLAGLYADEGYDRFTSTKTGGNQYTPSKAYDFNKKEGKQLAFTISPTLYVYSGKALNGQNFSEYYPHNPKFYAMHDSYINTVHTGLYVYRPNPSNPSEAWFPPCGAIAVNIDSEDKYFNKMSEAVNASTARDGVYFKQQWRLNVPFFQGFSTSQDGSNPSWKNCKLRNLVRISGQDYRIIGIERDYKKFSTAIRLERVSRSAYAIVLNKGGSDAIQVLKSPPLPLPPLVESVGEPVVLARAAEDVKAGDAVSLFYDSVNSIAVAYRSESKPSFYGADFGFAGKDALTGQDFAVITGGMISNDRYSFAARAGSPVYVRTVDYPGLNISVNFSSLQSHESYFKRVGLVTSEKSIMILKSSSIDGLYY